jgi:tetratricopeptide (TPR) repeat protein
MGNLLLIENGIKFAFSGYIYINMSKCPVTIKKQFQDLVAQLPEKDIPTEPMVTPEYLKKKQEEQAYANNLIRIETCIDTGNYQKAQEYIQLAKKIKTDNDLKNLEDKLNRLIQEKKKKYDECYQKADNLYQQGNYRQAREHTREARNISATKELSELESKIEAKIREEQEQQMYFDLAVEYYRDKKFEKAKAFIQHYNKDKTKDDEIRPLEEKINEQLEKKEEYRECLNNANIYIETRKYERARKRLKRAIEICPDIKKIPSLEDLVHDLEKNIKKSTRYLKMSKEFFSSGNMEKAQEYLIKYFVLIGETNEGHQLVLKIEKEKIKQKDKEIEILENNNENHIACINVLINGSTGALQEYLGDHPGGLYAGEIKEVIKQKQREEVPEIVPPKIIYKETALYPPIALRKHINARVRKVEVLATIDKDGHVEKVEVIEGHELLIDAAINCAKKWRLKPFLYNGNPKPFKMSLYVDFTKTKYYYDWSTKNAL